MPDRTCSIDGCLRSYYARGWCQMHYKRWLAHGDPMIVLKSRGRVCSIEGCDDAHEALGLCGKHYARFRSHGSPHTVLFVRGGDEVLYSGVHIRLRRLLGSARNHRCVTCGDPALNWAYDHKDPDERQSEFGPYSLDPSHYRPMCARCHKRFDLTLKTHCFRGHEFTAENTYVVRTTGHRQCRECRRIRRRRSA